MKINLLQRLKNLWYWSGVSLEEFKENPQGTAVQYFNAQNMSGQAYIIGLSEEEQSYKDSLNVDNKDTILSWYLYIEISMSQPKIAPAEDVEQKNLAHFLADYQALCDNYGLMVAGQMEYGPQGIVIKPIVIKTNKDNASSK